MSTLSVVRVLILTSAFAASGQSFPDCPEEALTRMSAVKSWKALREWSNRYRGCDDGIFAEGVSGFVSETLARKWHSLRKLKREISASEEFGAFVLSHINATAARDDLRAIAQNADRRCPGDLKTICKDIRGTALHALRDQKEY